MYALIPVVLKRNNPRDCVLHLTQSVEVQVIALEASDIGAWVVCMTTTSTESVHASDELTRDTRVPSRDAHW